jgi:hypothetical protein
MEENTFKVIPTETFNLQINGHELTGFKIISKWEGLVKFSNGRDWVIATQRTSVADFIRHFLTDDDGTGYLPVMASAKIGELLQGVKEDGGNQTGS